MYYIVNQVLYPLVQGCESKDVKIIKVSKKVHSPRDGILLVSYAFLLKSIVVQFCLGMMQRLITQQAVDQKGARYITDTLWLLMESGTEEVKVLQTVTLLLTSNAVVHGDVLARVRNLRICPNLSFFLSFSSDFSWEYFTGTLRFSRTWCSAFGYTSRRTVRR